jgi:hypothetical protein
VQISVWFRRKARRDALPVFSGGSVGGDDLSNKV